MRARKIARLKKELTYPFPSRVNRIFTFLDKFHEKKLNIFRLYIIVGMGRCSTEEPLSRQESPIFYLRVNGAR